MLGDTTAGELAMGKGELISVPAGAPVELPESVPMSSILGTGAGVYGSDLNCSALLKSVMTGG